MGRKRQIGGGVLCLALLWAATACGGGDGEPGAATPETVRNDGALATDVTIEATGEPSTGGRLTYGLEAETDGWNPTNASWSATPRSRAAARSTSAVNCAAVL